jgi:hypothetical protein
MSRATATAKTSRSSGFLANQWMVETMNLLTASSDFFDLQIIDIASAYDALDILDG